jgi:hypothetical protein
MLFGQITDCKIRIQKLLDDKCFVAEEDIDRARSFIQILRVFQAEVCCLMRSWSILLDIIQVWIDSSSFPRSPADPLQRTLPGLTPWRQTLLKHLRTC